MGVDLEQRLRLARESELALAWRGRFSDYVELVRRRPQVAALAHERIYRMIMAEGLCHEADRERYRFFEGELFGLDQPLKQLVEYYASAARRLEVRKRILLLMGPVGGGKSTLVTLLKRGLERFSRTEEGAVYGLVGCPMHEEPLHLIPPALRKEMHEELGVHIEGELCPVCTLRLEESYAGRAEDFQVERILLTEKERVGIGTFSPSDPKSQDIAELTGSIDLATIGQYGAESDPRAYRFDGELNIANRGLMEFVEMLKCDEKFLYTLLTLTQEQNIKTGRFAMIYADEAIISHTNENEYRGFIENKKNEALKDRLILVRVPYNLAVDDEVRIYEKLIKDSAIRDVHIAPHTLEVAAMFAVLSRLLDPKRAGLTLIKKLRLYNGQDADGFSQKDLKEIAEEHPEEGMSGLSPRYIINRLSSALVRENSSCLNPIDALKSLKEGLATHTGISAKESERYENLILETRREYDEMAKVEVQRAFVYSFEEAAQTLLKNYLDNAEAFINKEKMRDPITDEDLEPDERLMRSLEEQIGVTENAKRGFREEILIRISSLARRGQTFDYRSHDRLREAVEKKLFSDLKNVVKITTSAKTPDAEQLRRTNDVVDRLVTGHGYCTCCANELLRYVGTLLGR